MRGKEVKREEKRHQKSSNNARKWEEGRNTSLGKASYSVVQSKVDVNHGDKNDEKLRIENSHL